MFNDAQLTIDNLKGQMINDVHILVESVLQGYHKYKDSYPEGSNFASASARVATREIFRQD